MDRNQVVFVFTFEAAYVVDVVAYTIHALVEKAGLFSFELHIFNRLQAAVKYDHIVVAPQPSDVAVVLFVIRNGCEALVLSDY